MTFDPKLSPGQRLANQEICDVFLCGPQGGMRKSNRRNCLVLFTDHARSLYDDRWDEDGILHYTGMGLEGDQLVIFHLCICRQGGSNCRLQPLGRFGWVIKIPHDGQVVIRIKVRS